MRYINTAIRLLLAMTLLTGLVYPAMITAIAQAFFRGNANGSLLTRGHEVVGSRLIAQAFKSERYFWPRPSAVDFNPVPSGGSNLSPASKKLAELVDARHDALSARATAGNIPADLLFASGSGLDPHISPEAAHFQVDRIVASRRLSGTAQIALHQLVNRTTERRQLAFIGEPRVNVLVLNLALDETFP